jgi:hypothetical protein
MRGRGRWLLLPLGGKDVRGDVVARGSDLFGAKRAGDKTSPIERCHKVLPIS